MPLLVCDDTAAAGVIPVAEGLLREISAFGVLAADQDIALDQLELYAARIAGTVMILEAAEAAVNLRFGDEGFPFWYNTVKWDEHAPLSGSTADRGAPRPSQWVWSILGGWMAVLQGLEHSSRLRLLRAALWRARQEGLWSGLTLAIDLAAAGFLLNHGDLADVVVLLLLARDQADSDEQAVAALLGGVVPLSPREFLNAPLSADWVTGHTLTSPAARALVPRLLQAVSPMIDATRGSHDLGDWIVNQRRLFNVIGPLLSAVRSVVPKPSLTVRAMMTQLNEIYADAGSRTVNAKAAVGGEPGYAWLVQSAIPVAWHYRARGGEGWQERFCSERVLVPDELRPRMLDVTGCWPAVPGSPGSAAAILEFTAQQVANQTPGCPGRWNALPWQYAHPYVCVLRPEFGNPEYVGAFPIDPALLASHPQVRDVFARNHVTDPQEMMALLWRAARARPGRYLGPHERLLRQQVDGVVSGLIPLAMETDVTKPQPPVTWEPSTLIDELVVARAQASAEAGRQYIAEAVSRAAQLIGAGQPLDAMLLMLQCEVLYPWSADVRGVRAAALIELGERAEALQALTVALTLAPSDGSSWGLFADNLAAMPEHAHEAVMARFVAAILATATT